MFKLLSKIFHLFILFFTLLGLNCCMGFSLVAVIKGCSQIAVHRFLITVASLVAECELQGNMGSSSCGLQSLEHRLSSCGTQA